MIAVLTLWRHPEATVVITEPDPEHLELGAQNASANALQLLFELGGIAPSSQPTTQTSPRYFDLPDGGSAPALNVEEVMQKHGITNISILHADIQGAEVFMLSQVQHILNAPLIDYSFISTHRHALHGQCRIILRSHGYTMVAEHTSAESHDIDGLLVVNSRSKLNFRHFSKVVCNPARHLST